VISALSTALIERAGKHLEPFGLGGLMKTAVPGGHDELVPRQQECGGQMQGVQGP
jgi:hypothetical protein